MCTKHQGCQAGKIKSALPLGANDSCCASTKPTLNITKATVDTGESACCSGSCCSSKSTADEVSERAPKSLIRNSWLVADMDCPSCALKLEKAITGLEGVSNARVMFATEKLVVDFDDHSLTSIIEQTAHQTGFPLASLDRTNKKSEIKGWRGLVEDNLHILSISAAMLIAAIVSNISPQIGSWIFTLTCLLGLYPIARKAVLLAQGGNALCY